MPRWVPPMLATLTEERFSDPAWIFEPKFDGVRCLVFRDRRGVRLLSRNKLSLNRQYPEIEEAFRAQPAGDYVVDGEIVAFEGKRTSFARLQRRMQLRDPVRAKRTGVAVYLYVFDVVYAGGFDLTRLSLLHRKLVLRRLLSFNRRLRFTAHRAEDGEQAWRDACANGLEGVIAKRADSRYESGRSRDWLKFKCVNEQELVIGGWTDPAGARSGLGALLLGYYDDGSLVYAGKVGTGFDERTLKSLSARLASRERVRSPFVRGRTPTRGVHWVRPDLVAQIGFTEWTRDGQLRHPRFLGLRSDKAARQVIRETAT
ncbi:MAG TPA: non-homologous end-joining DNA ligase [Gemmatimonadaceae bacterium]|nr:non-homologous end-joining DNA ligase [Gemmatimonadaceae bacterium]